ncbi:hypothetical protein [Rheinheimera hassiensis]|uniref:hypothetical protein n=1 Tax=Rheinheimera hassiensis TaxID=1193627 RepID=UPI001F059273|nr:hypothetical protein [Rheinheimera hassiensis]
MPKFKAYATSTGDRNSYMLMELGGKIPAGYTEKEPPEPVDGYQVTWSTENNEWNQVEIPEQNGDIDLPA